MKKKDPDQTQDNPAVNTSLNNSGNTFSDHSGNNAGNNSGNIYGNNSGNNYGVVNNSVNISTQNPVPADDKIHTVEKAVWKSNVVHLVSEDRLEQALAEILKLQPPDDIQNQVVLLGGRLSQLKIQSIAGIINKEMELMEINKVRNGIMTLISTF